MYLKKRLFRILLTLIFFLCCLFVQAQNVNFNIPNIVLKGVATEIKINTQTNDSILFVPVYVNKELVNVKIHSGEGVLIYKFTNTSLITSEFLINPITVHPIPLWLSILPPLIAILMALFFREVVSSLFSGIFIGTFLIYFYSSGFILEGVIRGLLSIIDTYLIDSLLDSGHVSIIVFSMMIGGMVNIITKNGGMKGVVNKLTNYANSPRSGQLITWILGIAIFFDDYANTLVVGNTMRPVTDKLKISRQKLAYIVDSTAAPIAAIAFVTTWIGAELSYIESGIVTLGLNLSAYTVFLNSLSYSFYPIFTLVFMFMLIYRKVDFGPMATIEKKVRITGVIIDETKVGFSNHINDLEIDENIPTRWFNAAIPVGIVVFGTLVGLLYTGWDSTVVGSNDMSLVKKLSIIIGNSDSYRALLWSSLMGVIVAVFLSVVQKILTLQESIDSIINGFRTMLTAIIILVLAWSLALVTDHLHTADFISNILVDASISPVFVPLITFILAALVAFSTGSSWGTMAILYPLILPASWLITKEFCYGHAESLNIFYNVVASVLAGSVLGDHCSPISDTTILSSLASSCPHIEHVQTQMPYALTVGGVAALVGILPASLGIPSWITFPVGFLILWLIIKFLGKSTA